MSNRGSGAPTPRRPGLWSGAAALIVISLLVSVFTPFKLFILFLPIGLAPFFFSVRKK